MKKKLSLILFIILLWCIFTTIVQVKLSNERVFCRKMTIIEIIQNIPNSFILNYETCQSKLEKELEL